MARANKKTEKKSGLAVRALPLELISSATDDARSNLVSILTFDIGDNRFAIGVENTEGVVDCPHITPLPSAPDGILGVVSVRGRMTLVMDLSLGDDLNRPKRRLILLKGESQLGLLADHVEGVMALEPKRLHTTPARKGSSVTKGDKVMESPWPARAFFDNKKHRVPVIDVERLVEM